MYLMRAREINQTLERVEVEHGFASGSDVHAFWSNSLCISSSFTAPGNVITLQKSETRVWFEICFNKVLVLSNLEDNGSR